MVAAVAFQQPEFAESKLGEKYEEALVPSGAGIYGVHIGSSAR
jgi:hypothetical protein